MIIKLEAKKLFDYLGIEVNDPFTSYYNDYINLKEEGMIDILSNIKDIEIDINNEDMRDIVNNCYNRADNDGLINAIDITQANAIEEYIDNAIYYINNTTGFKAIKNIKLLVDSKINCFDYSYQKYQIEINDEEAKKAIVEIVNGEGLFDIDVAYLEDEGNGNIEAHIHYLLNIKLINDIWSNGKPVFDWEVNYWDYDKNSFEEMLKEDIEEYKNNIKDIIGKIEDIEKIIDNKNIKEDKKTSIKRNTKSIKSILIS